MGRRNFTRPHRLHALNELNVTPLLDLCFCLLIIFMIATPVMEASKPVTLPDSSQGGPSTNSKSKSVVLTFDANSMSIGGRSLTLPELRDKFKEYAALDKDAQPVLRIRGDRKAAYERFAEILEAYQAEHLTKLSIEYQTR